MDILLNNNFIYNDIYMNKNCRNVCGRLNRPKKFINQSNRLPSIVIPPGTGIPIIYSATSSKQVTHEFPLNFVAYNNNYEIVGKIILTNENNYNVIIESTTIPNIPASLLSPNKIIMVYTSSTASSVEFKAGPFIINGSSTEGSGMVMTVIIELTYGEVFGTTTILFVFE